MAKIVKNNVGGIPKLSSPSNFDPAEGNSYILAHTLTGSINDTTEPPGWNNPLIENAYGPGNFPLALSAASWFNPNEVIKIMRTIRVIVEVPEIIATFVAFVGAAGPYTYEVHHTHYDLDINIKTDIEGCGGIFPAHTHVTGLAFDGLVAYGTPTNTKMSGSNTCADAQGSSNDYVPPFAYGPPIIYRDFVAPGGSAGADLEWSIIQNDYGPRPPLYEYGYPPITFVFSGADQGAGIDMPNPFGDITVDGRVVATFGSSYPPDGFTIKPGYRPPTGGDYTFFPINWQDVSDFIASQFPQAPTGSGPTDQHIAQPTFDSLQIQPSLPFDIFPIWLIPLISDPWFGDNCYIMYVVAQPATILPGDPALDMWIALAKAQRKNFVNRRVIIYVDTGYLQDNGIGMSPGLISDTINVISNFCDALSDCGFKFGGAVNYMTVTQLSIAQSFIDDINLWLNTSLPFKPVGPTQEEIDADGDPDS